MNKKIDTEKQQSGSVLLAIVIMLPFLILIAGLYTSLAVSSLKLARGGQMQTHAQLATDAGVDYALLSINEDENWAGTSGQIDLKNDSQGRTTYQVSINDIDETHKTLVSVGRYFKAGSSTASNTVTVTVNLRAVSSGEYSVVSGVGGLIMKNNAKVLGGDILINGTISMTNSAQIGLASSPVNLEVAHQSCPDPPDSTYPRLCTSGENGEPITMKNSSHIYANVKANNQIDDDSMSNPGLTASSGVASQPLPPHDRAGQIGAISNTIDDSDAECDFPFDNNVTWPANTKINGDVKISNSCNVTVLGDVWITGDLEVTNSSKIIVANSLGTTRPTIMVDGDEAKFSNSSELKSNSSETGFKVITYKSEASCTTAVPGCETISGAELLDSQDQETIRLTNSASGPNTIFYARWSKVSVGNSGQIGALIGQTIELTNSGAITFGTSTGGGTKFWVIDNYRRGL